ncbi:MAG: hypothetical protein Q4A07_12730 [Coriobacteriales bacterium]|nr:hypothetical protein [Coriobacteriales bacterium]
MSGVRDASEERGPAMIYRDFQDLKLSGLGLGAMRLPVVDGDDHAIDEPAAMS